MKRSYQGSIVGVTLAIVFVAGLSHAAGPYKTIPPLGQTKINALRTPIKNMVNGRDPMDEK